MFQMHSELRSITAICVVEDVTKCPLGYTPITRTHDTETDADLWKDGWLGRRVTRYLCVSKSQGKPEHVVQDVQVLSEKELPPEGYSVIQQTTDSSQKAFKKKQLCYKYTHFKQNVESVVDIIIVNKLKNVPDGHDHVGEVNGMNFLIKKVSALTRLSNPMSGPYLSYNLPGGAVYPSLHDSMNNLAIANGNGNAHRNSLPMSNPGVLAQSVPNSPAHYGSPNNKSNYNTGTLSYLTGIEGVPFILREDLRVTVEKAGGIASSLGLSRQQRSMIPMRTEADIDREYDYDFQAERDVLYNGIM